MTDVPVVDRIRGVRIRTGANRPFTLEDDRRVVYVEQGHLNLFVVEFEGDRIVGRRRFVGLIRPGEMAFGAKPLTLRDRPGQRLGFLVVPSQGAIIVMGERGGVGGTDFDLDTVNWIDRWTCQLSEFLVRDLHRPRETVMLEADPNVPHSSGSILSAQHRDVVWVSSDAEMHFLGRCDLKIAPGEPLLPVADYTWLDVREDCSVSAIYSPTALLREELWPAFDRFCKLVLEFAASAEHANIGSLRRHRQAVFEARHDSLTGSLSSFGEILSRADDDASLPAARRTPLTHAAFLVAGASGVQLDTSPLRLDDVQGEEALELLARRSRIRTRRIRLRPGWWKSDGPAMVGFKEDDLTKPLALLPNNRGRYRAVDPSTGKTIPIDQATAGSIAAHAIVFHAPLPENARRLLDLLRFTVHGHVADFRTVLGMGVLGGLAALLTPILTGHILVEIIPRGETSLWLVTFGGLLVVMFGSIVFEVVRGVAALRMESRMDERLQAAVWSHLISLPAPFFRRFTSGDLADRASGYASVRQAVLGAAVPAAMGVIFSVFSLALLFYYSGLLALLVTALLLLLAVTNWILSLFQLRHYRKVFEAQGRLGGLVLQMINGLAKLRVANAENFLLSRWADLYRIQVAESLSARYWGAGQEVLSTMFQPISYVVIFVTVSQLLSGQGASFDLVAFLSFNAAFGQLAASIGALTTAVTTMVGVIPLVERTRPVLEADPESADGVDPGHLKGEVEFDNVSFRYESDAPNAVEEVSFRLRPGEYVALVGPSGCGKSTIFRLLLGFERPDAGTVFLDGHNLNSLDMSRVRGRMGVVLQHGEVVTGTIYDNIAGMSTLSKDRAWEAVRAAALGEDVEAMPMKMGTLLSEGGAGLSVGQRQKLLIARAVAQKPRILLFDEATSALDNRAQARVQQSLKKLGATRLVIAHRLSSIRDADRVFVMCEGRIVESGTYQQLIEQAGLFAELARRQILEDEDGLHADDLQVAGYG